VAADRPENRRAADIPAEVAREAPRPIAWVPESPGDPGPRRPATARARYLTAAAPQWPKRAADIHRPTVAVSARIGRRFRPRPREVSFIAPFASALDYYGPAGPMPESLKAIVDKNRKGFAF